MTPEASPGSVLQCRDCVFWEALICQGDFFGGVPFGSTQGKEFFVSNLQDTH